MKLKNITKLKIDCNKHGKSDIEIDYDSIMCKECYKEFLESEERRKKKKLDNMLEKERKTKENRKERKTKFLLFSIFVVMFIPFHAFLILSLDQLDIWNIISLILDAFLFCIYSFNIITILILRRQIDKKGDKHNE